MPVDFTETTLDLVPATDCWTLDLVLAPACAGSSTLRKKQAAVAIQMFGKTLVLSRMNKKTLNTYVLCPFSEFLHVIS